MHVIILKYVQVLCITIFFSNNVNCDKLLLHNEQEDQQLYRIGACTAACMVTNGTGGGGTGNTSGTLDFKSLEKCYKLCSENVLETNRRPLVQRTDPKLHIRLICRDSTNLIIQLQSKSSMSGSKSAGRNANQLLTAFENEDKEDGNDDDGRRRSGSKLPRVRSRRAIGGTGNSLSDATDSRRELVPDRKATANGRLDEREQVIQPEDNADGRQRQQRIYLVKVQESEKEMGERIVYMCVYSKVQHIRPDKGDNVFKIDTARELSLKLFDRDVGKYAFENESFVCQLSDIPLGEFGVYDFRISDTGCALETAKEPVNIYLSFVTLALLILAAFGLIRIASHVFRRTRTQSHHRAQPDGNDGDKAETDVAPIPITASPARKRLQSLDTFRGIAIMLMIFVNSGGGHYWWIEHATWNGLHVADLVFPWFLFIMGVCIPIALRSQMARGAPRHTILSNIALSNASVVKIENLHPNKLYNVTATVLSSDYEYYYVDKKQQFKTLPLEYMPGLITNVSVERYQTNDVNNRLIDAVISWLPAPDKTCHYEILCYASHSPDFQLKPIDVQQPEELYRYTINALDLNSEYMIAVRSKNTKNPERESELKWHAFHTPNCIDWHNSSQLCAPEPIENINIETYHLSDNHYQVNISWDAPRFLPDNYTVKLFDLHLFAGDENGNSITRNVTGDTTNVLVGSLKMFGPQFEVLIKAHSSGGVSTQRIIKSLHIGPIASESWIRTKLVFIIVAPILLLGLLKVTVSLICRRRAKIKRTEERCEYFNELEQKAPVDPSPDLDIKSKSIQELLSPCSVTYDLTIPINDDMEIDEDDIKLQDILGEGAFGLVRKGLLSKPGDHQIEVAVKMLKEWPRMADIKEFRREMDVMKSVGTHPNIVSIVGHYTKNVRKMMLLTEYCGRGNLLNYLRMQWSRLRKRARYRATADIVIRTELPEDDDACLTPVLESNKKPENVFNFDTSFVNDKKPLTYKNFAEQTRSSVSDSSGVKCAKIIENKLYPLLDDVDAHEVRPMEHNGSCTNSCKSTVEIIDQQQEANTVRCNIKVSPCECEGQQTDSGFVNNSVENRCYYGNESCAKESESTPTSHQLLEFARQVALGMEYLAKNKVVHRDLAARNVLVCLNNVVKIADFGLSRDIYQENLYRKTGSGKLPIKWLALESMTHQVYTSQSDVWSYGILLYEICTLGASPYPSISTSRLLKYLESGQRMERPQSCSDELYALMYSCWNASPSERPTFTKVINDVSLLQELDDTSTDGVINLDVIVDLQSTKTSDNSYLKPVEY